VLLVNGMLTLLHSYVSDGRLVLSARDHVSGGQ
jgi:hypothetical protein